MLALIQSARLLLKEESTILASSEDAAYFRMLQSKAAINPAPSPIFTKPPLSKKELATPSPSPPLEPNQALPKEESILTRPSSLQLGKSPPDKEENLQKKETIKSEAAPPPESKSEAPSPKPREPAARPYSQFRSILEKIAPELAILDSIPDDTTAKQIASRWKTKNQSAPISILSSGELPQHKALLSEIATALDVYFGPARFIEADPIEKEKQWKTFLSVGSLKMIVICDSTLWQLHQLRQFYKETPTTGVRMLGDVPIFLLPDLSLYLKDPLLKRSLWKALCSKLS